MKGLKKILLLLLLCLVSVIGLTACKNETPPDSTPIQSETPSGGDSTDDNSSNAGSENTVILSSITISGKSETYIDEFNFSDYTIKAVYSDNSHRNITLTENHLSTTDRNKLSTIGTHTLTATYEGVSAQFTVTLKNHTFEGVVFNDITTTYDGTAKNLSVSGLPTGAKVSYDKETTYTNVGEYIVKATISKEYYEPLELTATLKINKAVYDMSNVEFENKTVTYNGGSHFVTAINIPNGVNVSYTNNGQINAGTYEIVASFMGDHNNYETIADKTAILTIQKATITGVSFPSNEFVYDGTEKCLAITGTLPSIIKVSYENNGKITAGEYTVTAKFTTNENYNTIPDMTATLKINKATYDMSEVLFEDKTVDYNGETHTIEATNVPNGVAVSYINNGQTNAGTYTITARFTVNAINYNVIPDMTATLTINAINLTGITFDNAEFTYDGKVKAIYITGELPADIQVSYTGNEQTTAGKYTVTAKFTTNNNYNPLSDMTATLTIKKAVYDMSEVIFSNKTVIYDTETHFISATGLPNGVTVEYLNNNQRNAGTYEITAKFMGDNVNYEPINDKTAILTIEKAIYDMSNVVFEDTTVTYNGREQTITATGVPYGIDVTYDKIQSINVGVYPIVANFTSNNENYDVEFGLLSATLTITKAIPTVSDVYAYDCFQLNRNSEIIIRGSASPAGEFIFDPNQILTLGTGTYAWTFIPSNSNYENVQGEIELYICALVTFYAPDGTVYNETNTYINENTSYPSIPPQKEDNNGLTYTFLHWSLEENGEAFDFLTPISDDINLYPVYESKEIEYTVTYHDEQNVANDNIKTYTVSTNYSLLNLEKEHYIFDGWTDIDGNTVTKIEKGTTGNLDLYANWTAIEYAITYNLKYPDATNPNNPATYNIENEFDFAEAVYDEYHTFVGWYSDETLSTEVSAVSVGSYGNIALYAKWQFTGTLISSASQLQSVVYDMTGAYELITDIDLTDIEWEVIGVFDNPFTGYFNGAGYSINGKTPFGIMNGTLKNLYSNVRIGGTNNGTVIYCGSTNGLFFYNYGTIDSCWSTGVLSLKDVDEDYNYHIGSLVVKNYTSGIIKNSFSKVDIEVINNDADSWSNIIGGLVAVSYGKIENCYSECVFTIDIRGDYSTYLEIGGIAGRLEENAQIITSFANCDMNLLMISREYTQHTWAGGLVGQSKSEKCKVKGCIALGNITYNTTEESYLAYMGSISGDPSYTEYVGIYTECYANCTITGPGWQYDEAYWQLGIFGNSTAKYNLQSVTFLRENLAWDETIWKFENGQYPKLWFEIQQTGASE